MGILAMLKAVLVSCFLAWACYADSMENMNGDMFSGALFTSGSFSLSYGLYEERSLQERASALDLETALGEAKALSSHGALMKHALHQGKKAAAEAQRLEAEARALTTKARQLRLKASRLREASAKRIHE